MILPHPSTAFLPQTEDLLEAFVVVCILLLLCMCVCVCCVLMLCISCFVPTLHVGTTVFVSYGKFSTLNNNTARCSSNVVEATVLPLPGVDEFIATMRDCVDNVGALSIVYALMWLPL